MTISEIESKIINQGIETLPASTEEIKLLKSHLGIDSFPSTYIDFLERMGNGTKNGFLQGHSCFLRELPNLKTWAIELLQENGSNLTLDQNQFVFWMSQGYMFTFLDLSEGDDPPVYFYTEVSKPKNFIKISDTFTEFLSRIESNDRELFKI